MDIQLKNGEIMWKFPQDVGYALVALGLAKRYEAPAQVPNAPPAPRWIVGEHTGNGKITIAVIVGDNSQEFNERPKQATAAFKARGFDLPSDILHRYVALRKSALATVKNDIEGIRNSKENGPDIGQMLSLKLSSLIDAGYGEDA